MKILVIRFSSLGDVVLITPLFQKLKHLYPFSHLSFLTDTKYMELFRADPYIDRIIPYDVLGENLIYFLQFLKRLRRERYDIIIDCHIIPRSLLFLLFGKTARRRRLNKYSLQRRLMVTFHKRRRIPHIVARYLATIDGKNEDNYRPKIYIKKDEKEKIKILLDKRKGERKVLGFVPGASKETKMWQVLKYKKLALEISKRDNAFIIFFGSKSESPLAKEISKGLNDNYLDLSGKTNFRELAAFLEACDVLFTTDSGSMHIAVAVGTPVVAIFGPTVPEFGFAPYDRESVIISKPLACRPCSLHGTDTCPLGHHNCMRLIEVAEVRREIERMLYKSTGAKEQTVVSKE